MQSTTTVSSAVDDFRRARQKAAMKRLFARVQGKSADLLSYEDVRHKLHAIEQSKQVLREVPIDDIVGSVGRYSDFTKGFFPTQASDVDRWASVKVASGSLRGLPPIELYQIGDAYFVKDGHHRISVARDSGAAFVEAYVTEVRSRVPLEADADLETLLLKEEYADFLERTNLDRNRPDSNIVVTESGQYPRILEHIDVHRYYLGLERNRELPYEEAAESWHDNVYMPVVQPIRELGLLRDFPGRTEADLYLWIMAYQAKLAEELGWAIPPVDTAHDFSARFSRRASRVATRIGEKLRDALTPDPLEAGPAVGDWREQHKRREGQEALFRDVLVALPHDPRNWHSLDQALMIAKQEGAHVHGIHIMESAGQESDEMHIRLRDGFLQRCREAGVPATFLLDSGQVPRRICDRVRWTDLLVMNLAHPLPRAPLSKLGHGTRTILRRSPRPILLVPGTASPMKRVLLAYDGSPNAEEALYVSAHIGQCWNTSLLVLTNRKENRAGEDLQARARNYLEANGVQAVFKQHIGPAAPTILGAASELDIDLIVMGSFGGSPVKEVILGSTLGHVFRETRVPVLVCR
jgi:nucleotide-binding universal stress UspA family protein